MDPNEAYRELDRLYVPLDKQYVRRTRNLRLIPGENNRRGGKHSYAEWAHVIGIMQTLLLMNLKKKTDNRLLDIGCGTGLLGIASEPFIGERGHYVGIDVMKPDIDFCQSHYPASTHSYIHLDVNNPAYAPGQTTAQAPWAVGAGEFDALTALSVWTHFNEKDALFYFREVGRVLKPGGMALISFFLLDDLYEKSLPQRNDDISRYDTTPKNTWIFDRPAYESQHWLCPGWVKVPEEAIGVTSLGLQQMLQDSGLRQEAYYPGNWNGQPGAFFQDVLIFRKS